MTTSAERVSDGVDLTARAEQKLDRILDVTTARCIRSRRSPGATEEQMRGSQAATEAIEEVTRWSSRPRPRPSSSR